MFCHHGNGLSDLSEKTIGIIRYEDLSQAIGDLHSINRQGHKREMKMEYMRYFVILFYEQVRFVLPMLSIR